VADEYLVVTQGPGIHTPGVSGVEPGGGTIESREPGKTGSYGWTEKAGLSKYRSSSQGGSEDAPPPAEGGAAVPAKGGDKPAKAEGKPKKPEKDDKASKDKKKRRKKAKSDASR
jgi:hypothetical protein